MDISDDWLFIVTKNIKQDMVYKKGHKIVKTGGNRRLFTFNKR